MSAGPSTSFERALLNPRRFRYGSNTALLLLDGVSVRHDHKYEIAVERLGAADYLPLMWLPKDSSSLRATGVTDFEATRMGASEFTITTWSGSSIPVLDRPSCDTLLINALQELLVRAYMLRLGAVGEERQLAVTPPNDASRLLLRNELERIVHESPSLAWHTLREYIDPTQPPSDSQSVVLLRTVRSPLVFGLLLQCAIGTPLVAHRRYLDRDVRISYVTTLIWQSRTVKVSLGVEPVGLELPVPSLGAIRERSFEFDRPDGTELIGVELRGTTSYGDRSTFIRKAPRRSMRRLLSEKLAARNTVFRSQERTRFGRSGTLTWVSSDPCEAGALTIWLGFERRVFRPAILGTIVVFLVLVLLMSWFRVIGGLGYTSTGWHWFAIYRRSNASPARYSTATTLSSSALVTALVAPGALASLLSRPSEHHVVSQLLRVVRLLVLIASACLFGGALLIAFAVPLTVFATWLTGSLLVVGTTLLTLFFGYKNCERLPARPGRYPRRVMRRTKYRLAKSRQWLHLHPAPSPGESEPWLARRRRRISTARVTANDASIAPSRVDRSRVGRSRRRVHLNS